VDRREIALAPSRPRVTRRRRPTRTTLPRIAVASGKGGAGKTLVATNLAWFLAEAGHQVIYVDADVEGPSGHLFLEVQPTRDRLFSVPIPAVLGGSCSGCGECQRACAFHAILTLKDRVVLFPELCHGCGACFIACPSSVLQEARRQVGTVCNARNGRLSFWSAELKISEPRSAPLVRGLLEAVCAEPDDGTGLLLIDGPPGTSRPTVEAVRGADLVLLVTEPTPFGLHYLEPALEMCRLLDLPHAAVINRCDVGDGKMKALLEQQEVPILAEIPFSREIAAACAVGELAARSNGAFRRIVDRLAWSVIEKAS